MTNFLDGDIELDTGIFEEEEPENKPVEEKEEKIIEEVKEEEKPVENATEPPKGTELQVETEEEKLKKNYEWLKRLDPLFLNFNDCDFGELKEDIQEIQQIIANYYERGFDANRGRAEHDLGKLSAFMVRIGPSVGYMQACGEKFERTEKTVRAAFYMELEESKGDEKWSRGKIESMARVMAAEQLKEQKKIEVIAKMVTNLWFALRKFIDVLEGMIIRAKSEARVEDHTENAARLEDPDEKDDLEWEF